MNNSEYRLYRFHKGDISTITSDCVIGKPKLSDKLYIKGYKFSTCQSNNANDDINPVAMIIEITSFIDRLKHTLKLIAYAIKSLFINVYKIEWIREDE